MTTPPPINAGRQRGLGGTQHANDKTGSAAGRMVPGTIPAEAEHETGSQTTQ